MAHAKLGYFCVCFRAKTLKRFINLPFKALVNQAIEKLQTSSIDSINVSKIFFSFKNQSNIWNKTKVYKDF